MWHFNWVKGQYFVPSRKDFLYLNFLQFVWKSATKMFWRCWSCYSTFISSNEGKSNDLIIPKTQQIKPCSLKDSNLNDQPEKTDVWTRLEESLLNRGLEHTFEFSPQTDKQPVKHQDEMGTDVSLWYLLMGQSGQQGEEQKVWQKRMLFKLSKGQSQVCQVIN